MRHPLDEELRDLITGLSSDSADFRRIWAQHVVSDKTHGSLAFHHPLVGNLALNYETLRLPDEPDHALVTYTADAGSSSEAALRLLGALTCEKLVPNRCG
ncbi:MmyB family transcriptional regulator [Actinokineospora sp.]|uniref:MmyB family transcriptional regulator n=1 Tax=Actinokineospora sp. TaxID=1872133 RepID=UPI004037FC47